MYNIDIYSREDAEMDTEKILELFKTLTADKRKELLAELVAVDHTISAEERAKNNIAKQPDKVEYVEEFKHKEDIYKFIGELIALNDGDRVMARALHTINPREFDGIYTVHIYDAEIKLESDMEDYKLSWFIESLLYKAIAVKIL